MKHLITSVIVALLLAACATSNQVRQDLPYKELTANKPAKLLVGCVADRLETGRAGGEVLQRNTAEGYTISVVENLGAWGRNTSLVVDIAEKGQISSVKVFARTAFDSDKARLFGIIQPCF